MQAGFVLQLATCQCQCRCFQGAGEISVLLQCGFLYNAWLMFSLTGGFRHVP